MSHVVVGFVPGQKYSEIIFPILFSHPVTKEDVHFLISHILSSLDIFLEKWTSWLTNMFASFLNILQNCKVIT